MKRRYSSIILACITGLLLLSAGVWNYRLYSGNNKNNNPYGKLEYNTGSSPVTYRFPGEFENQQAIWMQWPSAVYDQGNLPVSPTIINIMKAFAPHIRVNLMTTSIDEILHVKDLMKASGYTGTNIHYYVINHLSIWTRDVGPIFIKDNQNRLSVVDFGFNNYGRDGNQNYINVEGQVDKLVGQYLKLPVIKANLISEGGAIESNGKGTLMIVEAVALNRNPGMTRQQIENEYKRVLGVKKVIWLKKGLAEDDRITTGHINEIARFADANTILLGQVLSRDRYNSWASQESYLRLEENFKILQNSTDQDGKPFKIIRVPMPSTLYGMPDNTGKIPVYSYINYAVTNGAVLIPSYWNQGRSAALKTTEDQVTGIFRNAFPGRSIIGINAESVNRWGGGIHCITQHMPAQ